MLGESVYELGTSKGRQSKIQDGAMSMATRSQHMGEMRILCLWLSFVKSHVKDWDN